MKRLVLHIYIIFMALTAMACPSNEVKLVQDWDKTFPKSEKVNHEKVTFKTQYGFTLAADLYIPKNAEGKLLKTEDIHPPKTGISVHFSGSLV